MKNNSILDYLRTVSQYHTIDHHAKIAAAIVYKNKIISIGVNCMKSHPFQKLYSRNEDSIYWHAETNAIFNALKLYDEHFLSYCDLYIARVKRDHDGNILDGYAKPCKGCIKAIKKYNIRNVYYTYDACLDISYWNNKTNNNESNYILHK